MENDKVIIFQNFSVTLIYYIIKCFQDGYIW